MNVEPIEPEGLEPKPEPTAIDRYQSWLTKGDEPEPKTPESEAATSGGEPGQGDGGAKPEEKPGEVQPRKLKYKAHGEEREATEEEAAQALAAHADYMKNIQAVKNREAELQAHKTLLEAIQASPEAQKALREVFKGQDRPQDAPPPANDPIARMEWEITQKVMAQVEQRLAPMKEGQQAVASEVQAQRILNTLSARDPLFNEVYQIGIPTYLQSLPQGTAKMEAQRLAYDPEAFLEVYGHMRGLIEQQKTAQETARTKTDNQPQAKTAKERVQGEAAKRSAPALEASGAAESGDSEAKAKNAKERAAILARIRRGEARREDSLRLMELSA